MRLSIDEILEITDGELVRGSASAIIRSVTINSNEAKKGALFIAIKGNRLNGHDFAGKALLSGASALIVSKKNTRNLSLPKGRALIRVKDTTRALGLIARAYRKRFSLPVIAITGSAGKTTTKDLVGAVLSSRWRVIKNNGSENNQWGVPLTLLKIKSSHEVAVVELGTNRPGDIEWLAYISCPDVAVFTNIGESHLKMLRDVKTVFNEKISLMLGLGKNARVVLNNDDALLAKLPGRFKGLKYVTSGMSSAADYRATSVKLMPNMSFAFEVNRRHEFVLRTPVVENISNALIAICCGRLFNLGYNNIYDSLKKYRFSPKRQRIKRCGSFLLIDDTYNANPVSFRSALNTLSLLEPKGKKILVCADMLELGERSRDLHRSIGKVSAASGLDVLLSYGKNSIFITKEAKRINPSLEAFHFKERSRLHRKLSYCCKPGDAVLVKGSHGMRMEKTVEFLEKKVFSKHK